MADPIASGKWLISKIKLPRRTVNQDKVKTLVLSMAKRGRMEDYIMIRQDGRVIDGLHRIMACKQLGQESVAVVIYEQSLDIKKYRSYLPRDSYVL